MRIFRENICVGRTNMGKGFFRARHFVTGADPEVDPVVWIGRKWEMLSRGCGSDSGDDVCLFGAIGHDPGRVRVC